MIPTNPPFVVLPISVIDEIRNLPENKVSFLQDVRRMFVSNHTGVGTGGPEVVQAVKNDLTRHIASTLDGLQDEIRYGFDKELGPCNEWKPIQVYPKMARIVALLSGRVFVGRPLSRDEEWIEATIMYTFLCVEAARKVKSYPGYLQSIVAPFLTDVKRVKEFKDRGGELLQPMINDQISSDRNEKLGGGKNEDEQGTMISWIMRLTKEGERHDPRALANHQMGLSMAAIHTTTMAVTSALYDFAAHPEFIQPLRDEIQQVIDEDGYDVDGDGLKKLKKSSMPKLWKLDSFLKESQRLSPPQLRKFQIFHPFVSSERSKTRANTTTKLQTFESLLHLSPSQQVTPFPLELDSDSPPGQLTTLRRPPFSHLQPRILPSHLPLSMVSASINSARSQAMKININS